MLHYSIQFSVHIFNTRASRLSGTYDMVGFMWDRDSYSECDNMARLAAAPLRSYDLSVITFGFLGS